MAIKILSDRGVKIDAYLQTLIRLAEKAVARKVCGNYFVVVLAVRSRLLQVLLNHVQVGIQAAHLLLECKKSSERASFNDL